MQDQQEVTIDSVIAEMRFQMEMWERAAMQKLIKRDADSAKEYMDKADGIRGVLESVELRAGVCNG